MSIVASYRHTRMIAEPANMHACIWARDSESLCSSSSSFTVCTPRSEYQMYEMFSSPHFSCRKYNFFPSSLSSSSSSVFSIQSRVSWDHTSSSAGTKSTVKFKASGAVRLRHKPTFSRRNGNSPKHRRIKSDRKRGHRGRELKQDMQQTAIALCTEEIGSQ